MITQQENMQKDIEEMMNGLKCPKDFICYKSGFKILCKTEDMGLESFIACLGPDPSGCKLSISYGGLFFCQCPIRVYVAKHFNQ
jgi:hypothetical protein